MCLTVIYIGFFIVLDSAYFFFALYYVGTLFPCLKISKVTEWIFGNLNNFELYYHALSYESRSLVEATSLTPQQYQDFLEEINKIPTPRAPINGKTAMLSFDFMEDTGCRVNEMIHVRKKDLDFRTRILTVTMPKSEKECKCSKWKYRDEHTRHRILEYADKDCVLCHGKGKWKKPQRTTFTPRLDARLYEYCEKLQDDDLLFPVSRKSLWKWGKEAGVNAKINIFQQKEEKFIEGIFLHLFRALCSLRMVRDSKEDLYHDALVACKMRHSYRTVTDRYTRVDINYLLAWEKRTYDMGSA